MSNNTFITPPGTLQFSHVFEPHAFSQKDETTGQWVETGERLYRATLIFPCRPEDTPEGKADHEALRPLVAYAAAAFDAVHGSGSFRKWEVVRDFLKPGSKKDYDGFTDDSRFIAMTSKWKPVLARHVPGGNPPSEVINRDDKGEVERHFYNGAVARAEVLAQPYGGPNHKDGKGNTIAPGVKLYFRGLEFVQAGPYLENAAAPKVEEVVGAFGALPAPAVRALPAPTGAHVPASPTGAGGQYGYPAGTPPTGSGKPPLPAPTAQAQAAPPGSLEEMDENIPF